MLHRGQLDRHVIKDSAGGDGHGNRPTSQPGSPGRESQPVREGDGRREYSLSRRTELREERRQGRVQGPASGRDPARSESARLARAAEARMRTQL